MAVVEAHPSNNRLKTGLPPPCFYHDLYSSYRVEWEARKRKFTPSIEVSSLCYVSDIPDGSPSLLLVGMANGSLSILRQFGQQSQTEEEVLDQLVARGASNDHRESDVQESFGWRLVGSLQLGEGALTFAHVSSLSAKESVVLVGGVDGLWWWSSLQDLLQSIENAELEIKGKKSASRSKNQPLNHINDISIANVAANGSDIYFSTPEHKLYHISIPSLVTPSKKKTPSDWLQELPMPLHETSDNAFEITTLHLAAANTADSTDSALNVSLLVGTNQSKVHCWDLQKGAYSEALDLTTVHQKTVTSAFEDPFEGAYIKVTSITSIQPDWWTIAGTIVSEPSKAAAFRKPSRGHKRPVNFLGTWHGPSKSRTQLVSDIPEKIQGLLVTSGKLYSIGNSSILTVWESPYQLDVLHKVRTNAKSNKAICNMDDALAVAGVGNSVDLVQSTVRLQSLDLLQTAV